jgi:NDP-sugar pyrophosphorylase family protein
MNSDLPAMLLVGGMGTRLRPVLPSTPKPLASVGDQPFLELLVRQLENQGIRRLILCTGYLGDQIEEQFGDGRKWGVGIEYSREQAPLGTGGAVKFAQDRLEGAAQFLVMNGDSFLEIDLDRLIRMHRRHGGVATIAVAPVPDVGRYGRVQVGTDGRVTGFLEKTGVTAASLINAGVYIFDRTVLEFLPEGPASLEKDLFPQILRLGVFAMEQRGLFIDIGIPEDYARAQSLCHQLRDAILK